MKKYLEVICSILITLIIVSCDKENIELIGESADLEIYEKITDYCDTCYSYIVSNDNGVIYYQYAVRTPNYLIHKIGASGKLLWSKTISDFGYLHAYVADVIENSDNSIIVLGSYISSASDYRVFVAKLNSNGEIEWMRNYISTEMEMADCICHTNDGGYAISGIKGDEQDGIFIKKIDNSGQLEWNSYYDVYTSENKIVQTESGDFIVAGTIYRIVGDDQWGTSILKVNNEGEYIEIRKFLNDGMEVQDAIRANDNGCMVLFSNPFRLIKFDDNNSIVWERDYSVGLFNCNISNIGAADKFGITKLLNTGYIINGVNHSYDNVLDHCFFKIDNSGLIIRDN